MYSALAQVDIIPDISERMTKILTDPERIAYYLGIRARVREGHDQYVDDLYRTNDGTHLVVSRPHLRVRTGVVDQAWVDPAESDA